MTKIAASRIGELPLAAVVKGSTMVPCANCGSQLWVSPSSQRVLAQEPDAAAYCLIQCFPIKVMEARARPDFDGLEYGTVPGWEDEVRGAGLDDDDVVAIKTLLMDLNERGRDAD